MVVPVAHDKWLGEEGENNKKPFSCVKESRSPSIEQQKIVKEGGEEKRNLFGKWRSEEGKAGGKKNPANKITGKRRQGMRLRKIACSGL